MHPVGFDNPFTVTRRRHDRVLAATEPFRQELPMALIFPQCLSLEPNEPKKAVGCSSHEHFRRVMRYGRV